MRAEIRAALADVALLPIRMAVHLARHRSRVEEVREDLGRAAEIDVPPPGVPPRERRLSVFVACAEASGEIHLVNALRAVRRALAEGRAEPARFVGLGGRELAAEGVEIVGDPVANARMGLSGVVGALPYYARLMRDCAAAFEREHFDALFAVDSPALNVPLARLARRYGVRTIHFVTPQYWGWAPWRVKRYRTAFDLSLSILPFERAWFERRGVRVAHVGHPLLDELAAVPREPGENRSGPLVLLPGSRRGVIERNLPWMLRAAQRARARRGRLEVVIVQQRGEFESLVRAEIERAGASAWTRLAIGGLHAELSQARAVISVSGTVILDVLHHRVPAVVVYRLKRAIEAWAKDRVLTVPYFASVNLLAGAEVLPEFCFAGEGPIERADAVLDAALDDEVWRARCRAGLDLAALRLGPSGACERAARHLLALACSSTERAR